MAEDQASGPLSPERNEGIFRNDILPDYLPEMMRQADRPRMILLGGQPGAGKTAVLIASHAELDQTGPTIRIVGDDLRSYHPQFRAFQQQDPETASRFTQLDAGRWTEKLLAAAVERKAHIVFETTMRTPESVARVIGIARAGGYDIEARAVAVNPRLSWQGNHYRFEEMLHAGDAARIPPRHVHDAAVAGLRVSLEKLERENLVDRVQLRTRGGTILYDNERSEAGWSQPPNARLALEREQSRPMTRSELQRFSDDWNHVLTRMEERRAPEDQIATMRSQAADDVNHLRAQRRAADSEEGQRRGRSIFQNRADAARAGALVPARQLPDLTDSEIETRLQRSDRLAAKRAEIENLSRLVFGNSQAVSSSVLNIRDARSGATAAAEVRDGRLGEMAGEGKGWLRGPSPARQAAEVHAPQLAAALTDYGHAVDFERHQIDIRHRDEQARHRVEIPRPSRELSATLAADGQEQVRRLNAAPTLRREFEALTLAISKRLTPADKAELKGASVARIACSLGIGHEQTAALRVVHERVDALQEKAIRQNRERARAAQLGMRR